MSEYTFGDMSYSGGQPNPDQDPGYGQGQPGGETPTMKFLRERGDAAIQANKALEDRVKQLEQVARQATIGQLFEAKGYDRGAAALYQGEPDKLDEWLGANGAYLARTGQQQAPAPQGQPAGPATTVPPSAQADLMKMQQAGAAGSTFNQGSDDELAAALRATQSPEEFVQVAQAAGWQYNLGNMIA